MIIGRILPYTHRAGAGACSPPSPPADSWARLSSSTPHADLGSPRGSSQYICQPGVTSASAAMVAATAHQIYAGFSAGHNSIIWRRAADLPGCCGWHVNSSWNLYGIEFLQSARTGGPGAGRARCACDNGGVQGSGATGPQRARGDCQQPALLSDLSLRRYSGERTMRDYSGPS